jgi:hypothetical protein
MEDQITYLETSRKNITKCCECENGIHVICHGVDQESMIHYVAMFVTCNATRARYLAYHEASLIMAVNGAVMKRPPEPTAIVPDAGACGAFKPKREGRG